MKEIPGIAPESPVRDRFIPKSLFFSTRTTLCYLLIFLREYRGFFEPISL